MSDIKVSSLLYSTRNSLRHFEEGLEKIKKGTFIYDGSMPESCIDALYESKVEVMKKTIEYLEGFDEDFVMLGDRSMGKEGKKYFELVNG